MARSVMGEQPGIEAQRQTPLFGKDVQSSVGARLLPCGIKGSWLLCFNRQRRKAKCPAPDPLNGTSVPGWCVAVTGVRVSSSDRLVTALHFSLAHLETAPVLSSRDCVTRKAQQKRNGTAALAPRNSCLILPLGFTTATCTRASDGRQPADTGVAW